VRRFPSPKAAGSRAAPEDVSRAPPNRSRDGGAVEDCRPRARTPPRTPASPPPRSTDARTDLTPANSELSSRRASGREFPCAGQGDGSVRRCPRIQGRWRRRSLRAANRVTSDEGRATPGPGQRELVATVAAASRLGLSLTGTTCSKRRRLLTTCDRGSGTRNNG
jgi:hypothetical protein